MTKPDWKDDIQACFDDLRILERCRNEVDGQFASLSDTAVEPAFAGVAEELKRYGVRCKYWRTREKALHFQAAFPGRSEVQFEYILSAPAKAVDLTLVLTVRGRPSPGGETQEKSFPFLPRTPAVEILKMDKDDLAHDIVARYKRYVTEAAIDISGLRT
ncbi:MAG: hypothetical protein PHI34_02590 [Acidobacteriota bacterium]|nr:hypothetical protein [Acidobacteriota bacterium]